MNETMKPSCGEAYDATPVAVLAASETLTIALGMLTKSPVAAIVAGGLTGCVCSLALPAISGRILGRKRDAILSWWDENLEVYKKFKVENPDREPSKRAEKREERDLAIWWLDAMRLVRTKELMREKVEALIETGSRMPDGVNLDDYASTAGKDNPESLAAAIGDGMEAVTISVDAQSGMGGMLRVNDRVKVIQPNDGSLGGDGFTVIADSVRIAALDGNFSSGSGSSDGYSTVTLEVTPEQAGKIRTAGGLTLTLPSSADTTESGE